MSSFLSWTHLCISNWCRLSWVELTFVSRFDIFFLPLNITLYLELTSPFLYWTYLCNLNLCPNFFSWTYLCISSDVSFFKGTYLCISSWCLPSPVELAFVSRIDVFYLQLNLTLYLKLFFSFFSRAYLSISNLCLFSSVKHTFVSRISVFILQINLPL